MSANTFGQFFKISSFGESHGTALGVVIDGCPAGIHFDQQLLMTNMEKRRPGTSGSVSARNEKDQVEILSGIYNEKTLGTPIAMLVKNIDARSSDYKQIENDFRIGHADDVWRSKFSHVDFRGGGRSSGRETIARVMAGSVAQMFLRETYPELEVLAWADQIGPYSSNFSETEVLHTRKNLDDILSQSKIGFPSKNTNEVENFLSTAVHEGESYGGVAAIKIRNTPPNLGQPVFHKLKADFAAAVMSVGATAAFEFGAGVLSSKMKGSDFHQSMENKVYGGIRGGISTGEDIFMRVHFKPTSSIKDVSKKGRHDPCIVPRAVPVLESMIWLVLADHTLWARLDKK